MLRHYLDFRPLQKPSVRVATLIEKRFVGDAGTCKKEDAEKKGVRSKCYLHEVPEMVGICRIHEVVLR
ncbi:hypothetical protein BGAL_0679g00020 [Botrytis galanthina]|uniref:Uncharacterized protein n=1 Tax=Botrytis galanthina TaxID=278940 RepID=A0A4S8QKC5_9HELO|nr:hypothetical protein BGAL_0679g00020 [Botrytis galanthina]